MVEDVWQQRLIPMGIAVQINGTQQCSVSRDVCLETCAAGPSLKTWARVAFQFHVMLFHSFSHLFLPLTDTFSSYAFSEKQLHLLISITTDTRFLCMPFQKKLSLANQHYDAIPCPRACSNILSSQLRGRPWSDVVTWRCSQSGNTLKRQKLEATSEGPCGTAGSVRGRPGEGSVADDRKGATQTAKLLSWSLSCTRACLLDVASKSPNDIHLNASSTFS